jgi:hypothetical protein
MAGFGRRVAGAFMLDAATFEDVEHDATSSGQAAAVVVLASLATGLGYLRPGGWALVAGSAVMALAGWFASAGLLWMLGTRILPGKQTEADLGQLLRTVGFAQAPACLGGLSALPGVGTVAAPAALLWMLAATVVAVRQALDYDDTFRAVLVCLLALTVQLVVTGLLVVFVLGLGLGVRNVF